jgi:hypothetical protein
MIGTPPRPLQAYKKANKEYYNFINTNLIVEVGSKKTNENNFYYHFAIQKLMKIDENPSTPIETNHIFFYENKGNESFFYKNKSIAINKGAITELGRLLIVGWYYNLEDYAEEFCLLIIKQYFKNIKAKIKTDRGNLIHIIDFIKSNIIYYSNNDLKAIELINTI